MNIGALNLFDRYPNKLNGELRSHYDDLTYGDNLGVQRYPSFSPIGIDGGFYYARATFSF
jgi:iron complex outermembrane receptor protein